LDGLGGDGSVEITGTTGTLVITVDGMLDGTLAVEIMTKVGLLGTGTKWEIGNVDGR
jgi:hypothetical protein